MAQTYCGKSCDQCEYKEKLDCPGCKLGPGRYNSGDCDIAKCCRENGHMSCDTCTHSRNYCAKFNTRNSQAEFRRQKLEREARKEELAKTRATALGKWLWILFWLKTAGIVVSFLGEDFLGSFVPALTYVQLLADLVLTVAMVLVLVQMRGQCGGYRTGAICMIVSTVMNAAVTLFGGAVENTVMGLLLSIPATVIALAGQYKIYMAHSEMLEEVDDELSEKWCKLWRLYLIFFCVTVGSMIVTFFATMLGILLVLVGTVGSLVVTVMELAYLFRSARVFRSMAHIMELTA